MTRRTDERTQQAKREATSTGFLILSWGLTAILIYRFYVVGQSPDQLLDFFVVWLAGNAYVALATTLRGVQPFDARSYSIWVVPAIIAATVTAVSAYQGGLESFGDGAITFGVAFVSGLALFWGLQLLYRNWERRNLG